MLTAFVFVVLFLAFSRLVFKRLPFWAFFLLLVCLISYSNVSWDFQMIVVAVVVVVVLTWLKLIKPMPVEPQEPDKLVFDEAKKAGGGGRRGK